MQLARGWLTLSSHRPMPLLKRLFWVYFFLLIFEGALRKWFLPSLSSVLLVVRDPIAIWIILEAAATSRWPKRWTMICGVLALSLVSLCFIQLILGDTTLAVALFGLRSYLLTFPVAFAMGENLDAADLSQFARWTLLLAVPLTLLEIAQYNAPAGSYLNAGAGGDLGGQLDYAGGHVRASATFSFVTGPVYFFPLVASFILYGIVDRSFVNRKLLWPAAAALLIAVPVTGSRTLLFILAGLLVSVAIAALFGVSQLASSLKVLGALAILGLVVTQTSIMKEATSTLMLRLNNTSGEGDAGTTLDSRIFTPAVAALQSGLESTDWFGIGMGVGSNVGARLLTADVSYFLAGEGEWSRVINELGPIAGIGFMTFRVLLLCVLAAAALARVRRHKPLAWLLVPSAASLVLFGSMEQPTSQGFMVVTIAFMLAALKRDREDTDDLLALDYSRSAADHLDVRC